MDGDCDGTEFLHRFQPTRLIGYHFDAAEVVKVLGEHVRAERIDARVEEVRTSADGVQVRLADDTDASVRLRVRCARLPTRHERRGGSRRISSNSIGFRPVERTFAGCRREACRG